MPYIEILVFEFESTLASYNRLVSDLLSTGTTTITNYNISGLPLISSTSSTTNCFSDCTSNSDCVAAVQDSQTCSLYSIDSSANFKIFQQTGNTLLINNNIIKLNVLLSLIEKMETQITELKGSFALSDKFSGIGELLILTEAQLILDRKEITNLISKTESVTNEYQYSNIQTLSNYTLYSEWFNYAMITLVAAIVAFIFVML